MSFIKFISIMTVTLFALSAIPNLSFAKEPENRKAELKKEYKEAVSKALKYSNMGQIKMSEISYQKAVKLKKELAKIKKNENEMKKKITALKDNPKNPDRSIASSRKFKNKSRRAKVKSKSEDTLAAVVGNNDMPATAPPASVPEGDAEAPVDDAPSAGL